MSEQRPEEESIILEAEALLLELVGDLDHIRRTESLLKRIRTYKKERGII